MSDKMLLFLTLLTLVVLLCIALIAWRLRRLQARRTDAERRAAVAYEELSRLARELRRRAADERAR